MLPLLRLVHDVSKAIVEALLEMYIKVTRHEATDIARVFEEKRGFPQDAADGSHIPTSLPHHIPTDYCNRRGFYSCGVLNIFAGKLAPVVILQNPAEGLGVVEWLNTEQFTCNAQG